MNNKQLYTAWGGLFILCAALGAVTPQNGLAMAMMVLLSVLFFVPGAILLYRGIRTGHREAVCRIRNLSLLSLGLTLALIVANILSVLLPDGAGTVLYAVLIIVSSPMACGQFWFVSLFLWACLLMTSMLYMPKKK